MSMITAFEHWNSLSLAKMQSNCPFGRISRRCISVVSTQGTAHSGQLVLPGPADAGLQKICPCMEQKEAFFAASHLTSGVQEKARASLGTNSTAFMRISDGSSSLKQGELVSLEVKPAMIGSIVYFSIAQV